MGIEKPLKEYTKIALTMVPPLGVALEVRQEEEKGAVTCCFFQVCLVELFTACVY